MAAVLLPVMQPRVASQGDERDQSLVVRTGRHQVTGLEVTGTNSLSPWHPGGREQRVSARQQQALADRDDLRPGSPAHRDGPLPADVSRVKALKQVRDDPVALDLGAEMLANEARAGVINCRLTSEIDGLDAGLIRLSVSGRGRAHNHLFSRIQLTGRTAGSRIATE